MGDVSHLPLGAGPHHDADVLTGLPGARAWPHLLADHRRRNPDRTWVAVLRLDRFADLVQTHGGAAADLLLVDIAAAWESLLRGGDVLVRFEAADFGCAIRAGEMASVFAALDRLKTALPGGVTCSVAVAMPDAGESAHAITRRAWAGVDAAGTHGGVNRIAVLLPGAIAA